MRGQGVARLGDRPLIGVQIPLRRGQRAVPGDLPHDMDRNARIRHPGEPGMTQVVPPKVLIAWPGHHVIPMRGVTQDRGGDPAAAGPVNSRASGFALMTPKAAGDQALRPHKEHEKRSR